MADMNRTTKGALLGAGVGLLTGNGVNGVLKGAAVGAGVGAVTEKGRDGKNARKGAKVGAAVGAVTGVLTGNGLEGAIKGAVIGGTVHTSPCGELRRPFRLWAWAGGCCSRSIWSLR